MAWKNSVGAVLGRYGGSTAERALYRAFPLTKGTAGGDLLGPGRWPKDQAPLNASTFRALCVELAALDFWPAGSTPC